MIIESWVGDERKVVSEETAKTLPRFINRAERRQHTKVRCRRIKRRKKYGG